MNEIRTEHLRCTVHDGVGVLTIDNPPVNVLTVSILREMAELQYRLDAENIRALIIRSEGKYFCSGLDLSDLDKLTSESISRDLPWMQPLFSFWENANFPVIASVQRLCTGAGMELMLSSDICVASEGAKFSLPEVGFGLAPDLGGTARLTRIVGQRRAKKILLCGEELDAVEAERIGLIEYVVPENELEEYSMKLALSLADKSKWAMRFAKKGIHAAAEGGLMTGLLFEQAQSAFCCGRDDKNEAVKAFFEKREAHFND